MGATVVPPVTFVLSPQGTIHVWWVFLYIRQLVNLRGSPLAQYPPRLEGTETLKLLSRNSIQEYIVNLDRNASNEVLKNLSLLKKSLLKSRQTYFICDLDMYCRRVQ